MRKSLMAVVAVAFLAALTANLPAHAEGPVFTSAPGSYLSTYLPSPVTTAQVGGELTYVNADIQPHNVVADCDPVRNPDECGPDTAPWCATLPTRSYPIGHCPRFWSATVFLGGSAPVVGLDQLTAGVAYTLYCELHPGMKGTLVALPKS